MDNIKRTRRPALATTNHLQDIKSEMLDVYRSALMGFECPANCGGTPVIGDVRDFGGELHVDVVHCCDDAQEAALAQIESAKRRWTTQRRL